MKKSTVSDYLMATGLLLRQKKLSKTDLRRMREMDSRIMQNY
jgi:hypothetical protein